MMSSETALAFPRRAIEAFIRLRKSRDRSEWVQANSDLCDALRLPPWVWVAAEDPAGPVPSSLAYDLDRLERYREAVERWQMLTAAAADG